MKLSTRPSMPSFKTKKEMYEWAFFNLGNPYKSEDGRTYYGIDKNGTYMSHYVSQYSKLIDDNVEDGIKPVVQALHRRKYLTAGSCQSHKAGEKRWVCLLFYSYALREQFKEEMLKSKLPISFMNYVAPRMRDEKDPNKFLDYDTAYLTDMWNALVCRRYEKFYPLKLIIANTPWSIVHESKGNLLVRIRYHLRRLWFDYFVRWFLLDYYTKKVTAHIETISEYPM